MARQKSLPGMVSKKVQAIHDAADAFLELKSKRDALENEMIAAHDSIVASMRKAKLSTYRYGELYVQIREGKAKAVVRHVEIATE